MIGVAAVESQSLALTVCYRWEVAIWLCFPARDFCCRWDLQAKLVSSRTVECIDAGDLILLVEQDLPWRYAAAKPRRSDHQVSNFGVDLLLQLTGIRVQILNIESRDRLLREWASRLGSIFNLYLEFAVSRIGPHFPR